MNRPRTIQIAVMLSLIGVAAAGLILLVRQPAQPDEPSARPSLPRPARHDDPPQPPTPSPAAAASRNLDGARRTAKRFTAQYVALIHGHGRAGDINGAAPALIRELAREPPRVTPAQRRNRPTIVGLTITPKQGVLRAVATLHHPGGPPYPLSFYLERHAAGWTVTRLASD
jgi:hypothetical protein